MSWAHSCCANAHHQKARVEGVNMKNWPSILEQAIEKVKEAFGVSVTEYRRYLVERGGRERPAHACHLDFEYERTDQALKAAWRRIADLPKQIADDVPDPSICWYWAREFYWNVPGAMPDAFVEEVAVYLLQCQSSDVPNLLGQSPRPLQCCRCCELFTTLSSEEYRQAIHLDEQMQSTFLCPKCRRR